MKNNNIYFKMDHSMVKTSYSFQVVPANYSKSSYKNYYGLSRKNSNTSGGLFETGLYLESLTSESITSAKPRPPEYSVQPMLQGVTNDLHDTSLRTPVSLTNLTTCIIETNTSNPDKINPLYFESDEEDYTLNPDFDDEDDNDSDKDNKITKHTNTHTLPISNKSYK
uniref:Uncharacterized protein n=1 Tax=viral metagenome TaxID=1070528 RepID=A0A6C0E2D2_9ZZZZ